MRLFLAVVVVSLVAVPAAVAVSTLTDESVDGRVSGRARPCLVVPVKT